MRLIVQRMLRELENPIDMFKRLFHILTGQSKTPPSTAAPDTTHPALIKVNSDHLSAEERLNFTKKATEAAKLPYFRGHVEHGYALKKLKTSGQCPRCKAVTTQHYAEFIYATETSPRVLLAPAGYFCTECPTVIINEEMIRNGVIGNFTFQAVLGIEHREGEMPDLFATWNGQKTLYYFDEQENIIDIVTQSEAPSSPASKAKRHNSVKNRLARKARRINRRKKR